MINKMLIRKWFYQLLINLPVPDKLPNGRRQRPVIHFNQPTLQPQRIQ